MLKINDFADRRKTQLSPKPVCEDSKNKVLECYRSNPGRTLNCSAEAKEFAECVEQARQVRGRQYRHKMVNYYFCVPIYREYWNPVGLKNEWTVLVCIFMQLHHHYIINLTTVQLKSETGN